MAIRHPENFVSTLYRPAAFRDAAIAGSNPSAATVETVRASVEAGAAAMKRRRFAEAIDHYKTAQATAYKLLYPPHKGGAFIVRDDLMHPVGADIERGLAEAGLKLVESIQPDVRPVSPPVRVAGVEPVATAKIFDNLGFQLGAAGAPDQVTLGAELLAKGQASAASAVLRDAIAQLEDDDADDAGIKAAALLNLSAAQLAEASPSDAAETATHAAGSFKLAGDRLGEAQALHSAGVALLRAGNEVQANELLGQASALLADRPQQPAIPSAPPGAGEPGSGSPAIGGIGGVHELVEHGIGLAGVRDSIGAVRARASDLAERSPVMGVRLFTGPDGIGDELALAPSRELNRTALPTTNLDRLSFIEAKDTKHVALRWPASENMFSAARIDELAAPVARKHNWEIGVPAGNDVVPVKWSHDEAPVADTILDSVYKRRIGVTTISDLRWSIDEPSATGVYLAHIYAFVIPVALGDCYHELGNFERAEQYYLQAAGYTYINTALEAPNLWLKIARNVVKWGDCLFKQERNDEAKVVYSKLVKEDGAADDASPLYALAPFADTADTARSLLQDPGNPPAAVNPAVAHLLLVTLARWQYLLGGLDFFGLTFTPIFTFEYLQEMARAFAHQAIQAEREYINFTAQAEAEAASRRDLESSLAMATIEAQAQSELAVAAASDAAGAAAAFNLAQLRAQNAQEDRDAYSDAGYWQYISQSIAAAHGAHSDWHEDEIRNLARDMEQGSWKGEYGKLAAAASLLGGQKSYEYQLGRMDNQIDEMNATIPIAANQRAAADARRRAAALQAQAAGKRRDMIADALNAFESEVFTPELWTQMGLIMRDISGSYQYWAIGAAKLMERAYNFETDSALAVIRPEYSVPSTGDLLGSDLLLRDVDSFTYHYVANVTKKESHFKDVLSLRNDYPFQFREFLSTGKMEFETSLHDFDRRHPGFYGQRLAAVEIQVIGLLPPEGIRGSLRGGIASHYRQADGSEKSRIHAVDTLALSEYTLRGDSYLFRADVRELGLFEGHGVATSWQLDLPPGSNNLDYRLITDVQLILYYTARFSDDLRDAVIARPLLPGEDVHTRDFALRFDFPEVWYQLLREGRASFTLSASYLPRNEQGFKAKRVALSLVTADGVPLSEVQVSLSLPTGTAIMTTDAAGAIATEPGNALASIMGGNILGDWSVALEPADGSELSVDGGGLDPVKLRNIALIVEYQFNYRS